MKKGTFSNIVNELKFETLHEEQRGDKLLNSATDSLRAKAAEDCRTPRRCRAIRAPNASARFWSAAVLCRFSLRPIVGALMLLTTCAASAATNDLTRTMQKALFEEEGNHNLPAAIEAYQNIITRFDETRPVTATAIFRLGEVTANRARRMKQSRNISELPVNSRIKRRWQP